MSVRRPRRIFVAQTGRPRADGSVARTLAAGLFGTMFGALVVLLALPSDLFGRVPAPSGTVSADPASVAVVDGDTLRINETVLRLQGVAAPPRGQLCQRANASSFDCGAAAAEALAALVRGRRVTCQLTERDPAGYPQARCSAGETDINRQLVVNGWARARVDAPTFASEETKAKTESRGLWRDALAF